MKFNKKIKSIIVLGISLSVFFGCSTTLDPSGVYKGDKFLYTSDQTIVNTYNVLDAFLIWETENQSFVKTNLPQVFSAANMIRKNAPKALSDISKARNFYISYKGESNSVELLNAAISKLQDQTTNISSTVTLTTQFTNIVKILSTNTINSVLTQ